VCVCVDTDTQSWTHLLDDTVNYKSVVTQLLKVSW
jgi:hypothetical protein